MRATILAGIYGACAIAVLTFYSVHQWLDPFVPLLIGLVGIFLPCVVMVLVLEEDARPPQPNIMLLAESVLIAGIFGLALPGLWTASDMRLKALSNFPSDRSIEAALDDEQDNVRSTACRMMFDPRFEYDLKQATATLYDRPELAVPCLREVTQVGAANEVTRKLAVMWHQGLLGGTADQCINVAALDNLMIAEANRATMLLDCSLQAESPEVRRCCTDRAVVSYPDRKLLEQVKLGKDNLKRMGTAGPLVAASFGEDVFVSEMGTAVKQLRLDSPAYRRLSAEVACSVIARGEDGGDAESYMRWVFSEHEQCIPEDYSDGVTKVGDACDAFLADQNREDLEEALCRANLSVRKRDREEAAEVRAGVDLGDYAGNIDRGREHLKKHMLSVDNYKELIDSGAYQDLTAQDQKLVRQAWIARQKKNRREEAKTDQPSKREAKQQARVARTPDGREAMREDYVDGMDDRLNEVQRATGMSAKELRAGFGEDGEPTEEMKKKLRKLEERED